MKRSFTVRDMPRQERPRERLLALGSEALSTQEIVAVILGRGGRGRSVLDIAQDLVRSFKNLTAIGQASIEQLQTVSGIGKAKACQLKAALELARRFEADGAESKPATVMTPDDAVREARKKLKGKKREHFLVLCLNARNQLIRIDEVSSGSLSATVVHPREVFESAVDAHAASVIFVHNHPSGDTAASDDDIKLTRRLVEAGRIMGIEVLDHVIVSDRSGTSMKSRGLI